MAIKKTNFLKKENRDFDNILDSMRTHQVDVEAKTADHSVTSLEALRGTVFTNRGATAGVNFTLPSASADLSGAQFSILGLAAQPITASFSPTDSGVYKGDAAVDSIAFTLVSAIGNKMEFICDGTSWYGLTARSGSHLDEIVTVVT